MGGKAMTGQDSLRYAKSGQQAKAGTLQQSVLQVCHSLGRP